MYLVKIFLALATLTAAAAQEALVISLLAEPIIGGAAKNLVEFTACTAVQDLNQYYFIRYFQNTATEELASFGPGVIPLAANDKIIVSDLTTAEFQAFFGFAAPANYIYDSTNSLITTGTYNYRLYLGNDIVDSVGVVGINPTDGPLDFTHGWAGRSIRSSIFDPSYWNVHKGVFNNITTNNAANPKAVFNALDCSQTLAPTPAPTLPPTRAPTQPPTPAPTAAPTQPPTAAPTQPPTPAPTQAITQPPTAAPTLPPTAAPTQPPTAAPTQPPTQPPTAAPTLPSTAAPTLPPTKGPTLPPTAAPTLPPTAAPTLPPTKAPTPAPVTPTVAPVAPVAAPVAPTAVPTAQPTALPTAAPVAPTTAPVRPTFSPTVAPVAPTSRPTLFPTLAPGVPSPTIRPSIKPTLARRRTKVPTSSATSAPTKAPTAAPVTPPVVQINITAGTCFSAANTVESEAKGIVAIKDIVIGDKVRDASGNMVSVYSFGHHQPNATAQYLRIYVQGLAEPLEVSKDHMVLVNGTPIIASSIMAGDEIDLGSMPNTKRSLVQSIQSVSALGVYAPFTTSGTIVVSGVAASNYVTLQPGSSVLKLGNVATPFTMHWLSHVFQTPHRVICTSVVGLSNCRKWETYHADGISKWAAGPYALARWLLSRQNTFVMAALLVPSCIVAVTFHAFEALLSVGMVLLALLAATIYYYRQGKGKTAAH